MEGVVQRMHRLQPRGVAGVHRDVVLRHKAGVAHRRVVHARGVDVVVIGDNRLVTLELVIADWHSVVPFRKEAEVRHLKIDNLGVCYRDCNGG